MSKASLPWEKTLGGGEEKNISKKKRERKGRDCVQTHSATKRSRTSLGETGDHEGRGEGEGSIRENLCTVKLTSMKIVNRGGEMGGREEMMPKLRGAARQRK